MKLTHTLTLIASVALFAVTAQAAEKVDHKAHHPAASAAKSSPMPTTDSAANKSAMSKMDSQMATMRDKHEKMMKAKTPEERMALMAEHMKTMQASMAMMKDMHGSEKMNMKAGMNADMAACHSMMEKRMEMMESMMQMMMDQMSPAMK